MITIWRYGNTGVRNPARTQEALKAYAESPFVGHLDTKENQIGFEDYLREKGVIPKSENKRNSNDGTYGRKWRFVFYRNGFIYPTKRAVGFDPARIGGEADCITPLGNELMRADTLEAVEEVFLRSTSHPMQELPDGRFFSPLRWVLKILLELENRTGEAFVSFLEFATYVQTSTPLDDVNEVVRSILELREQRKNAENKKRFDRLKYWELGRDYLGKAQNFHEYADTNLRYMRLTGLFHSKGHGIILKNEKKSIAVALSQDLISTASEETLFRSLTRIPRLPTDESQVAMDALHDLIRELESRSVAFEIPTEDDLRTNLAINRVRRRLEAILRQQNEIDFANSQQYEWREIGVYLDMLMSGRDHAEFDDEAMEDIAIPRGEAPAYLEWSLWRAFLALDHLKNLPYQVRNFNVDGDLLPRSTAAGGMPDLVAEFDDCVVVIEVTLSESSRQQAMEGSPVRKHVADIMKTTTKPVFGLFIAKSIDTNTFDDFKRGVWYGDDESTYDLHIIPLTIQQFRDCFMDIFSKNKRDRLPLLTLMKQCDEDRQRLALFDWKRSIDLAVRSFVAN